MTDAALFCNVIGGLLLTGSVLHLLRDIVRRLL